MSEAARESHLAYFKSKQEDLEIALSTALRAAVSGLHPDPILFVSQHLAETAAKAAGYAAEPTPPPPPAAPPANKASQLLATLSFKPQFGGQLMPPRPSAKEIAAGMTSVGPVAQDGGIIFQGGPFGSVWLRIGYAEGAAVGRGLVASFQMEIVKSYIEHAMTVQLEKAKAGKMPSAIYCAIAYRALPAMDMVWLSKNGFKFYYCSEATGEHADPGESELVYYAWPDTPSYPDMVPAWTTSIEGASGIVLSPDGEQVLLAWERGYWHGPAGAVNPGESILNALVREAKEELNVDVDLYNPEHPPLYIGGYHKSRARQGYINDNFMVWLVRASSMNFQVDEKEIHHARWFNLQQLLDGCQARDDSSHGLCTLPPELASNGREKIDGTHDSSVR